MKSKASLKILLVVLLFVSLCFSAAYSQDKPGIAVLNFKGKNVSDVDASIVTDFVREALFRTDKYTLLEREYMEQILAEQAFQQTGCTTDECAVKVGKLLNVRNVIVGNVSYLGDNYYINTRLVSVEDGEVLFFGNKECRSKNDFNTSVESIIDELIEGDKKVSAGNKKPYIETSDATEEEMDRNIGFLERTIFKEKESEKRVAKKPYIKPLTPADQITATFGEVVVTGQAVNKASCIEIDGDDIRLRDAKTVDEALDFIQGVHVSVGNKNEPEIMLRGFSQDQVLVLVDGVPVSSPYYGYLDLSHISVNDIEKIKIIKGSASAIYGPNAMGGVINIITREPEEKTSYRVTGRFSDYNTMMGGIGYYTTLGDFTLSLAASKDVSGGYGLSAAYIPQLNQGSGLRRKSDYDKLNASIKLGYSPCDCHEMAFSIQHVNSSKGIPPHDSSASARFREFPVWKKTTYAFNDRLVVNDQLTISSRAYYDRYDNSMDWYDDSAYLVFSERSTFSSYVIGAQVYTDYMVSDSHTVKGSFNAMGKFHRDFNSTSMSWDRYHANAYSFGLEDSMVYMDKFLVKLGGSLDTLGEDVAVSPVMGVTYNPDEKTGINLDVSVKTRFPTLNHLYNTVSGNTALTAQKNAGFEVGISRKQDFLTGSVSLFINSVSDMIERANKNSQYQNIAQAYMNGIEASVMAELFKGLSCAADYTFMVAKDRNPAFIGRSNDELPYVPASTWHFRVLYKTGRITASLLGLVNGVMYSYTNSGSQETINPYSLWNLRLSGRVFNNADLSISLNNIFDVNYIEETGYPRQGRNLSVSFDLGI